MSIKIILCILAAICFALDSLHVPGPIGWTPAGFCLLTVALTIL